MPCLFTENISSYEKWSEYRKSAELFSPLINHIFSLHHLNQPVSIISTPGTNAVFACGERIVKIYFPEYDNSSIIEKEGIVHARSAGVKTPEIFAFGNIQDDRYLFAYLVMEKINGKLAKDIIYDYADKEKTNFARRIQETITYWNTPCTAAHISDRLYDTILTNERWLQYPDSLRAEIIEYARVLPKDADVFVHGDLNAANVLINEQNETVIIDFGEAQIAPAYYELPAIIFDLFNGDKTMISAFAEAYGPPEFDKMLLGGLLIHDFGGDYIRKACQKTNTAISEMRRTDDVLALINKYLSGLE